MNEVVRTISEEPVIFLIKDIFPKTLNDVGYDLRRKVITFFKCAIPNACHIVWNVDAFEGFTIEESPISNPCYTIWNVDVFKRITFRKSVVLNTCYSIRDADVAERMTA